MTPDDLDAIVARAASVYPEDAGWDGDEAERALTTVTQHVPALAAALREAWQERDSLNDARNVLADAVATLTQERDGARETVMADEVVARMVAHSAGLPVDFAVPLATVATETVTAIKRLREERDAALATVRTLNADIVAAAGELRVPIPTPGSDAARMLRANIILRQERDEARAERRAARLDRDAAEERLAALVRGGDRG